MAFAGAARPSERESGSSEQVGDPFGRGPVAVGLGFLVRSTTVQRLSEDSLGDISDTITTLAEAEGLEAHAESVRKRFEE